MDTIASLAPPEANAGNKPKRAPKQVRLWRAFWAPKTDELDADDAASTLFRFCRSEHVLDYRLVFLVAVLALIIHIVWLSTGHSSDTAAYLFPVYFAIAGWAYLAASKRLGVVDLFAREIATVCRVGTIFDVGQKYVDRWENMNKNNTIDAAPSVSKEDYFPIFSTNSQDLQALEALVVSYITEFYTYMKATRDSQRKLAKAETVAEAKEITASIIYTLFLGYESARKAIGGLDYESTAISGLTEFQPTRTEYLMIILLTELACYSFLCERYKDDDLRFERLRLRRSGYQELVDNLSKTVNGRHKEGNEKHWAPAQATCAELESRHNRARATLERCELMKLYGAYALVLGAREIGRAVAPHV